MPPLQSGDILDFFRDNTNIQVSAAVQDDARTIPGELFFLARTPVQNVTDYELTARWRQRPVIADMINFDAKSAVYKMLQIRSRESETFKTKVGTYLMESDLAQVLSLGQALLTANGGRIPDFVRRLLATLSQALVTARRWRLETYLIAAKLDQFHYDRMNVKLDGGWGKAASMKSVLATPWTDTVNAKPITDIKTKIDYARVAKSQRLNRLLLSTAAFDAAVATDEFADKRQLFLPSYITEANLPVLDRPTEQALLQKMTGVTEIVIRDDQYTWEDDTGATGQERLWPINAVLLEDTANDNNAARVFLGNAPVIEASMIRKVGAQSYAEGTGPDSGGEGAYGPFYYTFAGETLDPPVINARVVQRAWPIVGEPDSSAVLWVGNDLVDSIAVSDEW